MNREGKRETPFVKREDSLLVIIDAQEKLMPAISGKEEIAGNLVRIVQFAKIIDIPFVVTEQEKLGDTIASIKNLTVDVKPIKKIHFNCFSNSEFLEKVLSLGRKTLIIAGVEAHICVAQTAIGCPAGFTAHVLGDAIGSRNIKNKEIATERIRQAGGVVSSTEMIIYELLEKAGTEEFRRTLQFIK